MKTHRGEMKKLSSFLTYARIFSFKLRPSYSPGYEAGRILVSLRIPVGMGRVKPLHTLGKESRPSSRWPIMLQCEVS